MHDDRAGPAAPAEPAGGARGGTAAAADRRPVAAGGGVAPPAAAGDPASEPRRAQDRQGVGGGVAPGWVGRGGVRRLPDPMARPIRSLRRSATFLSDTGPRSFKRGLRDPTGARPRVGSEPTT